MKKTYLLLLLLTSLGAFAQEKIIFGLKAGVNGTGFHTNNSTNTDLIGFNLGGVANLPLNKYFGLQTELNLNRKGGIYQSLSSSPFYEEIKLTYVNLPVLLQFHITQKFKLEVGPEAGLLLSQQSEVEFAKVPTFDVNANGGLSYTFESGIFIQGRYAYGLTQLFDGRDYKNSCISLSLGYFYF